MKKNYFYSLFAALMLFVAMPATAQNFAISDLYGKWHFEAEVEWAADATDEQKAQISGDCEVTIKESASVMAEIWGFAGSAVQQNVNRIGNKEGQDMLRLDDPNNSVYPAKLWNNLYIANLNGDNPYGYFNDETLEWEVEQLGYVYYNVDAVNGLITVPDFTIVQIDDTRTCKQGKLVATFTEVKMTLVEADAPKAVDDVSGSYKFKAGTSTFSTMENSVIPTEFAVDLVKKSDDNRTYEATIAIEGYENVTLPTTFDGDLLSLNFDSTYIYTDEANAENSIRFADMNGSTKKQGAVQFKKNDSGFSLAAGGFSFVTDYVEEKEGKTEAATKTVQWYMDGTLKLPSDAPEFDWVGVYTVKVNSNDITVVDKNVKMEWPAEFQMEIGTIQLYDPAAGEVVDAYAVNKFMGFDIAALGGWLIEPAADGSVTIPLNGDGYNLDMAPIKWDNEAGNYWALTNKQNQATELKLTLNADGTMSIDAFCISTHKIGEEFNPIVLYKNVTVEKYVAPAFNWAGTYKLEAKNVVANDGGNYPSEFYVTVNYDPSEANPEYAGYYVVDFMGNDIGPMNYGGIPLEVAEDGNSANLANGNVYSLGEGNYMKIFDAEEKANPVAITLGENGAISMADFTIVAGAWGDDNNNTKVASYKNVTLKKVLGAPVLKSPDTSKDINSLQIFSFNFGEEVKVDVNYAAGLSLMKDEEKVADFDLSWTEVYENGDVVFWLPFDAVVMEPGTYTLELPAGLVTAADGKEFVGAKYEFTVVAKAPSYSISPNGSADVNSIEKITIKCENVAEIAVDEAKQVWLTCGVTEYAGVVVKSENNIEITFKLDGEEVAKIEEEGEYVLTLPEGLFTMRGLDDSEVAYPGEEITYNVVAPSAVAPLEVANVTVTAEGLIEVKYNQEVRLAWNADWTARPGAEIVVFNENNEEVKLQVYEVDNGNIESRVLYTSFESEWNPGSYVDNIAPHWEIAPLPAGTYTLDVSQILLEYAPEHYTDEYGYPNTRWQGPKSCEGTYTITVEAVDTAIDGVEAEVENDVIYDLTGRRVNEITKAGIYIVNGKKVLVK